MTLERLQGFQFNNAKRKPRLAQADIGFAIGCAGTDTAMETADVIIMNDNLERVADTMRLPRHARGALAEHRGVMAIFGTATMWMADFANMGASLLAVGNGLRLLHGTRHERMRTEPESAREHQQSHAH